MITLYISKLKCWSTITILSIKLLIVSYSNVLSQSNNQIIFAGKAIDFESQPLAGAAVRLFKLPDSTQIQGLYTDSLGNFSFKPVIRGQYLIEMRYIGYENSYSTILTTTDTNLVLQTTKSIQTEDVIIAYKQKLITREPGKVILNVENSIVSSGSNGLELLKRVPGIVVNQQSQISVQGKSEVLILLDGKPLYLSGTDAVRFLQSLPANQIARIELLTQAPAKYDASGNAGIIDIRLKKRQADGLIGNIELSYGQGVYAKPNGSLNLNYGRKKTQYGLNYSIAMPANFEAGTINRTFESVRQVFEQKTYNPYSEINHLLRLNLDHKLSTAHTIGFQLITQRQERNATTNSYTRIRSIGNPQPDSSVETTGNEKKPGEIFSANLNYRFAPENKKRTEWTTDFDMAGYSYWPRQSYITNYYNSENLISQAPFILKGNLKNLILIQSVKTDFAHNLHTSLRLEAGVKYTRVLVQNMMAYRAEGLAPLTLPILIQDMDFRYLEKVSAGYISLNYQKNHWNSSFGLRAEHTNIDGRQAQQNSDSMRVRQTYTQLFPTFQLGWYSDSARTHMISVMAGRRIDRPDYKQLNPFVIFLDPYSAERGNPLLRPQFTYITELSYSFMQELNLSLSYSQITNQFNYLSIQNTENRTIENTTRNVKGFENYSAGLTVPITLSNGKWMITNYFNVYQIKVNDPSLGIKFRQTTGIITHNQQVELPRGWAAELEFFWCSVSYWNLYYSYPFANLSFGIQKKLLKEKLFAKLSVADPFIWQIFPYRIQILGQDAYGVYRYDVRVITATVSWSFAKGAQTYMKERKTGIESESQRINNKSNR